ncbi:YIP1 family protein [Acetobacterium wieringae]|uniref:Yip1 domain protein n=1 Tax=Acetobacterium wieringae TaxID=52694 RepID=A0A1F2PJ11_9FIRM|nr:YIP1 family protein [Acetobacterium wieringae]OFV71035.1 Yip1 domain protein [Acetobacterium wieringae]
MEMFLEMLNRPADAFNRGDQKLAWSLVGISIAVVTVFDVLMRYLVNGNDYPVEINLLKLALLAGLGVLTYLGICGILWGVCKLLGSQTGIEVYLRTWGLTYIPTIICGITVVLVEVYFTLFWNNSIWGFMLNIVLVGILIWKTILYVVFLKEVAGLDGKKLAGAFVLCGIGILILAFINMIMGLKTPIL